ncbi:MAG: NUDIX domain-containing protein [Clostridia bacterium]|nr:NUDIX domain-containing protein [Clostridia bacterium]
MAFRFCPQCGHPLTLRPVGDEGEQPFCADCRRFFFDNAVPCVLVAIVNERDEVLLLRQAYITDAPTLCSGYVKNGDTLEDAVRREVLEETGQQVERCRYVGSWYYAPKGLIMAGFLARVTACPFASSAEVDSLFWEDMTRAQHIIARENNLSGTLLDACVSLLAEDHS